ncbi:hypothetical protein G4B88_009011 [Cannabis sativa]|uniref:Uncharacterized protein n=1 Tax=Cannabis sativa TaxID=3483 RepID=A0A7J6HQ88_CANSA|nr:hypothetical protein G4B88_009011 [Cannabis sativa]
MGDEKRGSIAFFSTYRPPLPLDIYSSPLLVTSRKDELHMTDGLSYNYNAQIIPSNALKKILTRPKMASEGNEADVDSGRLSAMVFVSERENLETLHIALQFKNDDENSLRVKVFSFSDVFDTFNGIRMEDSGCIAGDYLVYVTTKDESRDRRQPWTAVYKTNLKTSKTSRLTLKGVADLSPAVSPSGKQIAVASFQNYGGWDGEIEDLKTDIFVMNTDPPLGRKMVIRNGGWPSWGSDNVIFFHRKVGDFWGVFRADISKGRATEFFRVTPDGIDAMTPAAINATTVAVATIRQKSKFSDIRSGDDIERQFHKLESPQEDVGLFRVSGVFPTFSQDGSKLAFVDNEFKAVWVADNKGLLWNQNPEKDVLYVCMGPSFNANKRLDICAIPQVSSGRGHYKILTALSNNAFPSTSPDESGDYGNGEITRLTNGPWTDTHCQWSPRGDWIVFSSTRDKPKGAPETDNGLDPGFFAVFIVKANDPSVVIRVLGSGDDLGGHVNHPFFSPDGKSIVVTADLAAVSVDPISLPLFLHSVRPYGDIFSVDIDPDDINKNKNVKNFKRLTHSSVFHSDRIGKTMAEHTESAEAKSESLIEKITEKIHGHGDSSSPSSDSESEQVKPESPSSVKTKIFRLFGRERPVHQVFGGGKHKEKGGSIGFFSAYRPPVPLDIYSSPQFPLSSCEREIFMTDRNHYNYNGQAIPSIALKKILTRPKLACQGFNAADVDSGRLSGMIFVSERDHLEKLYIAFRFNDRVKIFCFADVYGTFDGVRMEDRGCVAGDYLVYVTTKDDPGKRRQPWTAVYKTHLITAQTRRLTPLGQADLSPSVSPSGMSIAVASFENKGGWDGEIEDLKTDIIVMNVEEPCCRRVVINNGGWPSWGSDFVIFFHRKVGKYWGVFRTDLSRGECIRVTPEYTNAMTPAAINATTVAVAVIRGDHRHIVVFDSTQRMQPNQITLYIAPEADHFNPFVIDGGKRIGYHRAKTNFLQGGNHDIEENFKVLDSPCPDVGLFRVSGVFPTFSKDGSKLAFFITGTKIVFRSTRYGGIEGHKNLYIMENAECGEFGGTTRRLTTGNWTDTHCSWSPNNDWIVFSSSRHKSPYAPKTDNGLDPGFFAVFLVNANNPCVVVRVFGSGYNLQGHVNHPFFSPDGRSIVVTSDLAAVSADPVSMPILPHSVRPYGDIFTVDIDPYDINNNWNVPYFRRLTHSRYENTSASWTKFSTKDPHAVWNSQLESNKDHHYMLKCPYAHPKTESLEKAIGSSN